MSGHDYQSLLYNFLDELLFAFCGDDFVCKDVKVVEFDEDRLRITVSCKGERFDLGKHPQVRSYVCGLAAPRRVLGGVAAVGAGCTASNGTHAWRAALAFVWTGHRGESHHIQQHANPQATRRVRRCRG